MLGIVIGQAMDCQVCGIVDTDTMFFVGLGADPVVAAAVYAEVHRSVCRLARERYGSRWSTPHTSFALGFVSGADQKLKRQCEEPETKAIVLAKAAIVQRLIPSVASAPPRNVDRGRLGVDVDAYRAGRVAGSQANLTGEKQLTGGLFS